jgi:uncharacterized protein YeeX (DUF496 family)|tara:strand:- start:205 stop:495 length:291 start_codon:yes stop_codon:yes gene_type:complete
MTKKTLKHFIEDASKNIVDDRAATKSLLMNLLKYMQVSDDRHKEVGLIAAKYLETLQRSNEQLVKLAALMHKKESNREGISEEDKQELFDLINQEE